MNAKYFYLFYTFNVHYYINYMQNIFYKYRLGSVVILLLTILILMAMINNPDFDDKYFVLTVVGMLIMMLLFIAGMVIVLQRLSKVHFKYRHLYFAIGLFNLLTSISLFIQLRDGILSWMWIIILLPFFVGLFSIIDTHNLDKKAAYTIEK